MWRSGSGTAVPRDPLGTAVLAEGPGGRNEQKERVCPSLSSLQGPLLFLCPGPSHSEDMGSLN